MAMDALLWVTGIIGVVVAGAVWWHMYGAYRRTDGTIKGAVLFIIATHMLYTVYSTLANVFGLFQVSGKIWLVVLVLGYLTVMVWIRAVLYWADILDRAGISGSVQQKMRALQEGGT